MTRRAIPGILVQEVANVTKTILDTRDIRLQIGINKSPKHLDIMNLTTTALATNAGNGFADQKETLFSIPHTLGYSPKVFLYMFDPSNSSYAMGAYFPHGAGAVTDEITYQVSSTSFSIIHIVSDPFHGGYTSGIVTIQAKYLIFSNPINTFTDPALR